MTLSDLLPQRLYNQHLAGSQLEKPEDVVRRLGAVQAQDYPAAKWSVAERTRRISDIQLDRAFAGGTILRTHMMRPTWHFVTAADIRWMLKLTGPRVNTAIGSYYRKMKLDDAVFERSHAAIAAALRGGKHLTRAELSSALRHAGVTSAKDDRMRLSFIMLRAELDGLVCSGPRVGKQFTYALLEDRVPRAAVLDREEARAELARRYFMSHGPATLKDFRWWSGLTAVDARAGLEAIKSSLAHDVIDGKTFWRPKRRPRRVDGAATAYLLPTYDECFVAYRDRAPFEKKHGEQIVRDNGQTVVIGGRVAGTWKRTIKKDAVALSVMPFASFTRRERDAVAEAADRFARFLTVPVTLLPL